jgi:hypothetical protein
MADKKISALTASTIPLAGTEVLPIAQSGSTVKVSVNNLTAGRSTAVSELVSDDGAQGRWTITQDISGNKLLSASSGSASWRSGFVQANPFGANMTWSTDGNTVLGVGNFIIDAAGKGITTGGATALGLGVNGAVDAVTIDAGKNVGVGTATPTSGSLFNFSVLNAGIFATLRGSVASSSGVPVTIAEANQNHEQGTFIVSCGISSGAPTVYSAVAIVSADNNVLRVTTLQSASLMTITVSGTDIQATQSSGGAANILFTVTRVA